MQNKQRIEKQVKAFSHWITSWVATIYLLFIFKRTYHETNSLDQSLCRQRTHHRVVNPFSFPLNNKITGNVKGLS